MILAGKIYLIGIVVFIAFCVGIAAVNDRWKTFRDILIGATFQAPIYYCAIQFLWG